MTATYHLLNDLGVYKKTLRKNFEDNDRSDEFNGVRELLDRRTQRYTVAELRELIAWCASAHDECVDACPEDYSPVEVYVSRAKIETFERATLILDSLELTVS